MVARNARGTANPASGEKSITGHSTSSTVTRGGHQRGGNSRAHMGWPLALLSATVVLASIAGFSRAAVRYLVLIEHFECV